MIPGERLDSIIEANQSSGRYLISIQGMGDCEGLFHSGSLDYEGTSGLETVTGSGTKRLSKNDIAALAKGHDCHKVSKSIVCSLDTNGFLDESVKSESEETLFLSFDLNTIDHVTDDMTDFAYNIYGFTQYPSYLSE